MSEKERFKVMKGLREAEGALVFCLDVFGDQLAAREGYKGLKGMDAVYFYLVHKFSWPPSQVKGMSFEDIRFVLTEEMHGFVLPKAARGL
ncbi:hypothetical protein [Nevskia sp.]|uniref:hypothetical protein n=1 Tax=Nevskia sp. TaxID=1929292 RepID=UPI003F717BB3